MKGNGNRRHERKGRGKMEGSEGEIDESGF